MDYKERLKGEAEQASETELRQLIASQGLANLNGCRIWAAELLQRNMLRQSVLIEAESRPANMGDLDEPIQGQNKLMSSKQITKHIRAADKIQ